MPSSYLYKIQNFYPAVVKNLPSVGLVVEYFVYDPIAEMMIRKRIKLSRLVSRCKTKHQRLLTAQNIADELNAKLRGGWTPLHQTEDARIYTRLIDLQSKFLTAKKAEGCRDLMLTQYKSVINLWLRWCEDNGFSTHYSGTFLHAHAVRYMDDVLEQERLNCLLLSLTVCYFVLYNYLQIQIDTTKTSKKSERWPKGGQGITILI